MSNIFGTRKKIQELKKWEEVLKQKQNQLDKQEKELMSDQYQFEKEKASEKEILEKKLLQTNQTTAKLLENFKESLEDISREEELSIQKIRELLNEQFVLEKNYLLTQKENLLESEQKSNEKHDEAIRNMTETKLERERILEELESKEKAFEEWKKSKENEYEKMKSLLESDKNEVENLIKNEYEEKESLLEQSYINLKDMQAFEKKREIDTTKNIYSGTIESGDRHRIELGNTITNLNNQLQELDYIKTNFRGDPEEYYEKYKELEEKIEFQNNLAKKLRIELNEYRVIGDIERIQDLKNQEEKFKNFNIYKSELDRLYQVEKRHDKLIEELEISHDEEKSLQEKWKNKIEENTQYQIENKKLREENEDLNKKIKEEELTTQAKIERRREAIDSTYIRLIDNDGNPILTNDEDENIVGADKPLTKKITTSEVSKNENDFLKDINKGIENQGFNIPTRLLYSFHTSLKCADMAILTVLAGVSGSGKSTLGDLYAFYGGLIFHSIPVQPNWDSNSDLLGYFDAIQNQFNATPLLRILNQSQSEREDSTKPYLHIILLDEMNLAHIELYFNQFLSKLEDRRRSEEIPQIDVDLGAGIDSIALEVLDNVFWIGTMNQDETVKSLSAKVIDRGNVLYFPSPKTFESNIKKAQKDKESPLLLKETWDDWIYKEENNETLNEIICEKKEKFEKLHEHLIKVNRSLGHRGWQTIEKFIKNYPNIREMAINLNKYEKLLEDSKSAMSTKTKELLEEYKNCFIKMIDIAYTDIVAMKVFPKLQGVDVDKKSRFIVDNLPDELKGDFEKAIDNEDEIFQQISSDYLNNEELQKLQEEFEDLQKVFKDLQDKINPPPKNNSLKEG